jgi:hypothetical protein
MKEMYKSPVITVEELLKEDVLCLSSEDIFDSEDTVDNVASTFSLLVELEDIL